MTGGEEQFVINAVAPLTQSYGDNISDQTNFGVTNRKVYPTAGQGAPYTWSYGVTYVAPAGYKVSVTSPDLTVNERFLHQGNGACTGCGTQGNYGYDNGLCLRSNSNSSSRIIRTWRRPEYYTITFIFPRLARITAEHPGQEVL